MFKINKYGDKIWKNNKGLLHREDGPAVEYANGDKVWFINGKCHREDGPAKEYIDGRKVWYFNGQLHRLDGPAFEFPDGEKYWYYYDKWIDCNSQEEFLRLIKMKVFW